MMPMMKLPVGEKEVDGMHGGNPNHPKHMKAAKKIKKSLPKTWAGATKMAKVRMKGFQPKGGMMMDKAPMAKPVPSHVANKSSIDDGAESEA